MVRLRKVLILLLVLFTNSNLISQINFGQIYRDNGVHGSLIIYDQNEDVYLEYNSPRNDSSFLPASTFKILNSLIALETEVISDENEIIKWDGEKRGYDKWDMDHNLRTAIKYSAVWFYQELARRAGKGKIQHFVDSTDYGNRNINGKVDSFWLNGELRISPKEQISFLRKLNNNELPFSQRNINIVKDILIIEETDKYTLRAKTGWAVRTDKQIGWFVGYLEQNKNVYFFAVNIDILENKDAEVREKIARKALQMLGLLQ